MQSSTGQGQSPAESQIVILGASTRALAASACRAGWSVSAADLFCDLDLRSISRHAVAVPFASKGDDPGYPWNLRVAASQFPPNAPWCYTGAVENDPDLIDSLSRVRPLAGNGGACVRQLRDPRALAAAARVARLAFPETRASPDGAPCDGTWLVKPLSSAGGRGIRPWTPSANREHPSEDPTLAGQTSVWQRFVSGMPLSASYCFDRRGVRLLGTCRQLIGEPWCHAGRFAWCGAVTLHPSGDASSGERLVARLQRLGGVLADRFQPTGLVGVDLIADPHGHLTVIEVNPRPTASMELFERMGAGSIAGIHMTACGHAAPAGAPLERRRGRTAMAWAKAVLFAPAQTPVTQGWIDRLARETGPWTEADGGWPSVADIPRPAQTIAVGGPVVTLFATAGTGDTALAVLRDRVARIDAMLSRHDSP